MEKFTRRRFLQLAIGAAAYKVIPHLPEHNGRQLQAEIEYARALERSARDFERSTSPSLIWADAGEEMARGFMVGLQRTAPLLDNLGLRIDVSDLSTHLHEQERRTAMLNAVIERAHAAYYESAG